MKSVSYYMGCKSVRVFCYTLGYARALLGRYGVGWLAD